MAAVAAEVHGFLAVDKPQGWTSHDVVARLRRLVGQRSVGHAGTLDPMATGLLPLGLGQGTRLLEYLGLGGRDGRGDLNGPGSPAEPGDHALGGRKRYEATLRLGAATDTYDAEGRVTETASWEHVDPAAVEAALAEFTGKIEQRPPLYSAIKQGGEPLYRRARRGEQVEVPVRRVTVYALALTGFAPPDLELTVDCGAGTYVRSLAHDLGMALDTRAHLSALRRTRVGALDVAQATPLTALAARDDVLARLLPLDLPLRALPALVLSAAQARDVIQGRRLPLVEGGGDGCGDGGTKLEAASLCRAYDQDRRLLALLRRDAATGGWQPHKVFARAGGPAAATD